MCDHSYIQCSPQEHNIKLLQGYSPRSGPSRAAYRVVEEDRVEYALQANKKLTFHYKQVSET